MKRAAQRAASRDRKRRMTRTESIPKTNANYPISPPRTTDTIEDCLAELESSIPLVRPSNIETTLQQPSSTTHTTFESKPHQQCQLNADLVRDKVELWNQNYSQWNKDKHKPPPAVLLPSFDIEMTRHFKLQELSTFLLEASLVTNATGIKSAGLKMPSFERWLLDARLEDPSSQDPILPQQASIDMKASQRLVEELVAIQQRADAEKLVKNLCWRSNQIVAFLQKQQQTDRTYLWKKGDLIDVELPSERSEDSNASLVTLVYRRPKHWKKPFCIKINQSHYDKLKSLFYLTHRLEGSARLDRIFHLLLMLLLLRYSSLSGGHLLKELRGGGMQGAIHESVFDVLETMSKHIIEGFGSPFNCFLPAFGSAFFHDLDWHFGSIGNFFHLPFAQEAARHHDGLLVQANPPFAPGIMSAMSQHIIQQVAMANKAALSLAFVVIVPSSGDLKDPDRAVAKRRGGEAMQTLLDTDSQHIVLDAKEHGYIEGAQHLRPTRYKESLYDTSVIIISSTTAAKRMDIETLEHKLREAFRSKHRAETEARRSLVENDQTDDSGK